jgi:hypothetical protein
MLCAAGFQPEGIRAMKPDFFAKYRRKMRTLLDMNLPRCVVYCGLALGNFEC